MTNREFFETVVNANINEEITAYATEQIEKMNARNEKRRTTLSKTQLENIEIGKTVLEKMELETVYTAKEIAEMVSISTQKANAVMKMLVVNNSVENLEVKNGNRLINGYKVKE